MEVPDVSGVGIPGVEGLHFDVTGVETSFSCGLTLVFFT